MKNVIPYCNRVECDPTDEECIRCAYFSAYEDCDGSDGYCNYWDLHSPNECPDCHGSGYGFEGEQCDRCNGTGEIKGRQTPASFDEVEAVDFCDIF